MLMSSQHPIVGLSIAFQLMQSLIRIIESNVYNIPHSHVITGMSIFIAYI